MQETPYSLDLTDPAAADPAREVVLPADELATAPPNPGEVVLPEDEADDGFGLPKRAVKLADGRIRLPLLYPVTFTVRIGHAAGEKKTFSELVLRRLNGEDRKFAAAKPEDQMVMALAARSAGFRLDLFNALYEQMDAEDTTAIDRVIGHFLGLGPRTGR